MKLDLWVVLFDFYGLCFVVVIFLLIVLLFGSFGCFSSLFDMVSGLIVFSIVGVSWEGWVELLSYIGFLIFYLND